MTPDANPQSQAAAAYQALDAETVEQLIRRRLSEAIGGWRGSIETALPTVAFVLVWVLQHDVRNAVIAAGVVVAVALAVRLLTRTTTRYVFSAVFATAIAAFFALRSGQAEDAFLPGILASAAYGVVSLLSVLGRWPLVGFLVAAGDPRAVEDPMAWRRDRALVRVCSRLTLVLVVLFAVRVAIMLPMYFAGEVALLGVAKIVLGWPAYVLAIVVMGMILVRGRTAVDLPASPDPSTTPGPPASPGRPSSRDSDPGTATTAGPES